MRRRDHSHSERERAAKIDKPPPTTTATAGATPSAPRRVFPLRWRLLMFHEGGLALLPNSFFLTAVQRCVEIQLVAERRAWMGAANGASPGAGDPVPHHHQNYPEWTPAVICHPDRQRQREVEEESQQAK